MLRHPVVCRAAQQLPMHQPANSENILQLVPVRTATSSQQPGKVTVTYSACVVWWLCRDEQGATAYHMCIGDAARSLIEEKEVALKQAGRSNTQPRSRPGSRYGSHGAGRASRS